jgi:hypothetical protein
MIICIFLHTVHGQSYSFPRTNACFFQASKVTSLGGALLNRSQNSVVTYITVWFVCGLPCTHMLPITQSSTGYLLVLAIVTKQPPLSMPCKHMQLIVMPHTTFEFHSILQHTW